MYESRLKKGSVKITILVLTMAILITNIPIGITHATDSESDTTLMEDNLVSQNETIVVTGGFYDTQLSPLVNYSVEVYHSVPGADELLAKNITAENGSFSVRIPLPNEIKDGIFLGLFNKFTKFSGCYYDTAVLLYLQVVILSLGKDEYPQDGFFVSWDSTELFEAGEEGDVYIISVVNDASGIASSQFVGQQAEGKTHELLYSSKSISII